MGRGFPHPSGQAAGGCLRFLGRDPLARAAPGALVTDPERAPVFFFLQALGYRGVGDTGKEKENLVKVVSLSPDSELGKGCRASFAGEVAANSRRNVSCATDIPFSVTSRRVRPFTRPRICSMASASRRTSDDTTISPPPPYPGCARPYSRPVRSSPACC